MIGFLFGPRVHRSGLPPGSYLPASRVDADRAIDDWRATLDRVRAAARAPGCHDKLVALAAEVTRSRWLSVWIARRGGSRAFFEPWWERYGDGADEMLTAIEADLERACPRSPVAYIVARFRSVVPWPEYHRGYAIGGYSLP